MATVASQALTASPLENPARLMEKYCGSCTFPNTPSPTATSAPTATAINTASPDDLAGTTVVGASASDIAVPLNPDRPDLDAIDVRDALGRQCWRRRGRAILPPLHAGPSTVRVDDPAVADACVLVHIQPRGWLCEGSVEVPLLFADRQGADDRSALETAVEVAGLVLVGEAHRAVHGAAAKPRLDLVAVTRVSDRLVALHGDLHRDRVVGGGDLADVVGLGREGWWRWRARRVRLRCGRGCGRGRLAVGGARRRRLLLGHVHEQYADPEHRNGDEGEYRAADLHHPLLASEETPLTVFCQHNGQCREKVQARSEEGPPGPQLSSRDFELAPQAGPTRAM